MSAFIQELESRTLFSTATAATLASDKGTITSDAVNLRADLASLAVTDTVQTKAIAAQFKGLPTSQQATLKALEKDQAKGLSLLSKDVSKLTSSAKVDASKATAAGVSLLIKVSQRLLTTAQLDITLLQKVTVLPLATLQGQLASTTASGDYSAITTAFPTNTALSAAVVTAQTDDSTGKTTLGTAAVQFQTDVLALATDLSAVQTAKATFPNLVGTFDGSITEVGGAAPGGSLLVDLTISTESATGLVTGTATNASAGFTEPLTGTVTLNGKAIFKTVDSNGTVTFVTQLQGTTLSGTYASRRTHGTSRFIQVG